jgi:hypothetical protein
MSTAVGTKVEAKWDTQKRNEVAAKAVAGNMLATFAVLQHVTPEQKEQFENTVRANRVQLLKHLGVKTPLELVKAMAEVDANLYGSQVVISGDDNKAEITYEQCAVWTAMKQIGKFTPEQEKQMGEGFEACGAKTIKEFGFTSQTKFDQDRVTITISR